MNKKRMQALIDTLEGKELTTHVGTRLGFNMMHWVGDVDPDPDEDDEAATVDHTNGHACGTVACIAGWAAAMARIQSPPNAMRRYPIDSVEAQAWLELGDEEAELLFTPFHTVENWDSVTVEDAVDVLSHLLKTGCVDWGRVNK